VAVRSKASGKRAAAARHLAMGWWRASTAGKEQRHRRWSGACSATDHAKLELGDMGISVRPILLYSIGEYDILVCVSPPIPIRRLQ